MKELSTINRTVEITAEDLKEFLRYKGFNASDNTRFEITGTDHNYNEISITVGNGGHPDAANPIVATWVEKVDAPEYIWGVKAYDPNFGDDKECKCGHPYYRHFDTYDNMLPVGCKYCYGQCDTFK